MSRAAIVRWYLEEIALPYEFVELDMQAGEHRQPDYLAINPMGKIPAIADGDFKLWESGAILLYLANKYGKMPESPEYRAEVAQWVLFANSTLATGVFVEANRDRETPNLMPPLNQILETRPYLMGDEFGVADVAVGSMLSYMSMMLKMDLGEYPALAEYGKRLSGRPAFRKAFGDRG
jgi:glutathione S-transferase